MDYYIDIKVLPDPEFKETALLNALFAKLHRALVELGNGEVGVSFPAFKKTLGDHLRLHGSQAALERLMRDNWLKGMRDYTHTSDIAAVPAGAKHRIVKRLQAKSNVDRLRRRSIAKGWVTADQAIERIPLVNEQRLQKPFLQLKSCSTSQPFRLFIEHGQTQDQPLSGSFSAYGLSRDATVPWF
jgi:CRISPR-associated endonuclease Csy4